jgi:hypothetical protein
MKIKRCTKTKVYKSKNNVNRWPVMVRTIGGFCNGDICTLKREMEITDT